MAVTRRTVYPLAAGLLFALWLLYTLCLWFVGQLMSIDEEWQGWGDVLLNPYLMGLWVLLAAGFGVFALLHLRWRKRL